MLVPWWTTVWKARWRLLGRSVLGSSNRLVIFSKYYALLLYGLFLSSTFECVIGLARCELNCINLDCKCSYLNIFRPGWLYLFELLSFNQGMELASSFLTTDSLMKSDKHLNISTRFSLSIPWVMLVNWTGCFPIGTENWIIFFTLDWCKVVH